MRYQDGAGNQNAGEPQGSIGQKDLTRAHMVPTKPEVVKTAEGQKELWPDNPFWFGIEIETRKKRTKYESENQKMLVNVGTGVKEGLAEISQVYEVDSKPS